MKGLRLLKRLIAALRPEGQTSYSQCGEDCLLHFAFSLLEISRPTYLDIGANHPADLSNTYYFYLRGSRGVCVEPDPFVLENFRARRPHDLCLNIGISESLSGVADFYVFDDPTLSTFSSSVKDEQVRVGQKLKATVQTKVESINQVIERHFPQCPNLISLDTEGLDVEILENLDFSKYRPEVICVETLTNVGERKMAEIFTLLAARGYTVFGDTYVNTIFVDAERWQQSVERRQIQAGLKHIEQP